MKIEDIDQIMVVEHESFTVPWSKEAFYNELTKNEFKIMKILMNSQGNIVNRDTIIEDLWDSDEFISENTLTVNINRLRKKLETIGIHDFIITKKGQGYLII